MMKRLSALALLLLTGCVNPMLSTEMAFDNNGVSVNPTLSGSVGDATVYIQP